MKIHYTLFGAGLSGGNRVLYEIMNRLQARGHEVLLTFIGSQNDHSWFPLNIEQIKYIPIGDVPFNGVSKSNKIFNMHPFSEIMALLSDDIDCDINIATYCFTAYPVFLSGNGKPFYHMQHFEPIFFQHPLLQRLAYSTYYLPISKIANSTWLQNQMKEMGVKVPLLTPGIDTEVFHPDDSLDKFTDKEYQITCFSGRDHWKGFRDAEMAMRILKRKYNNIEFFVYGGTEPSPDVWNHPFTFLGKITDEELTRLYATSDIIIAPSHTESFPLPPLEAMASGAAVITTPYGTEDYTVDDQNCILVDRKNPNQIVSAVEGLINNQNKMDTLKSNGIKTAEKFNWDNTIVTLETILND